jgi:hypothetical protein
MRVFNCKFGGKRRGDENVEMIKRMYFGNKRESEGVFAISFALKVLENNELLKKEYFSGQDELHSLPFLKRNLSRWDLNWLLQYRFPGFFFCRITMDEMVFQNEVVLNQTWIDKMNQDLCCGRFSTIEDFRYIMEKYLEKNEMTVHQADLAKCAQLFYKCYNKALVFSQFSEQVLQLNRRNLSVYVQELNMCKKNMLANFEKAEPPLMENDQNMCYVFQESLKSSIIRSCQFEEDCGPVQACVKLYEICTDIISKLRPLCDTYVHSFQTKEKFKSLVSSNDNKKISPLSLRFLCKLIAEDTYLFGAFTEQFSYSVSSSRSPVDNILSQLHSKLSAAEFSSKLNETLFPAICLITAEYRSHYQLLLFCSRLQTSLLGIPLEQSMRL